MEYKANGSDQIFMKMNFKNGKKHGEQIEYYNNGSMKEKVLYENNILEGDFIEYAPDGSITGKGKYKDGKKQYIMKGKKIL